MTVLSQQWLVEFKEWDDREWVFRFRGEKSAASQIANGLWGVHSIKAVRLVEEVRTEMQMKEKRRER